MPASRINPPSLTQWTETHLKAIYGTVSEEAFENAFDAFIARHAELNANGLPVSLEQYKRLLWFHKTVELHGAPVQLSFKGVIEVPLDIETPATGGTVGIMYTATASASQTEYTVDSSLNIAIHPDESLVPGTIGYFDPRRVTRLSEVSLHEDPVAAAPAAAPVSAPVTSHV